MNNNDIDKKADELLRALGKELSKSRTEYANKILDENQEDPPLIEEKSGEKVYGRGRIHVRRFIILVAVLVLLMAIVVVSSEGVREKLFNYFMEDKDGYTEIKYLDGEEIPELEFTYLPEGFELIDQKELPYFARYMTYENKQGKCISLAVYISEKYDASVDNGTLKRKSILIHDHQGYLFYDKEEFIIIWQVGDFTFELYSSIGEKKTIEIAKSVSLKK